MAFVSKAVSETLYWGFEAFRRIVFGEIDNSAVTCITKRHTFVALLCCFWRAGEVYGWCSTVMGLICIALKFILHVDCKVASKCSIYKLAQFLFNARLKWSTLFNFLHRSNQCTWFISVIDVEIFELWTSLYLSGTEVRHVYGKWKCVHMLKWLSKGFYTAT